MFFVSVASQLERQFGQRYRDDPRESEGHYRQLHNYAEGCVRDHIAHGNPGAHCAIGETISERQPVQFACGIQMLATKIT